MSQWHEIMQIDFEHKLRVCEHYKERADIRAHAFIRDMRKLFESRKDAADLGIAMWEPTVKQLNYLNDIYQTVR